MQRNVFIRLGVLAVTAVLSVIGVTAVTNSSSAATGIPIPFTQKVVKISNAYQSAQCNIVINGHDFNGNNTGYMTAQSQASLLGGQVKSTAITCVAYDAAYSYVDDFTYVGDGATLLNTRKAGSYGLSSTYHICIYLTRFDYNGGYASSSKCN